MDSAVVVVVVVVAAAVVGVVAGGCDAIGDARKRENPRRQDADGAR